MVGEVVPRRGHPRQRAAQGERAQEARSRHGGGPDQAQAARAFKYVLANSNDGSALNFKCPCTAIRWFL